MVRSLCQERIVLTFTLRRNVSGLAPELLFVGKNSHAFLEPLHTLAVEFTDMFNQHLL